MNSYITLDGKKYVTVAENWRPPVREKPMMVRYTLLGSLDVTYGPGAPIAWEGEIRADVTPATGYGSPSDLITSLMKKEGITFIDHSGTSCTVHAVGPFPQRSLQNVWDGPENTIYTHARLVKA